MGAAADAVEGAGEPCLESREGQEAGRGQRGLAPREQQGKNGAWYGMFGFGVVEFCFCFVGGG